MSLVKILVADGMSETALKQFQEQGSFDMTSRKQTSLPELLKLLPDYDALFVRSATQVTREVLEAGSRLKLVLRLGAGLDNVDAASAKEKNITVMNTAAANALSAAEQTMALMYAMARRTPQANQSLLMGEWRRADFVGFELTGKTLGVIGCGQIGRIVMQKAHGIGMKVVGYDPFVKELRGDESAYVTLMPSLEGLLSESDIVTVHIPRTADTKNLFNSNLLSKMKKSSYILNVSRGGIVDESALLEALNSGHIAGAAIDVFEKEPPTFPHKLITHPNVVATPHLGASTVEAQERVGLVAFKQCCEFFKV